MVRGYDEHDLPEVASFFQLEVIAPLEGTEPVSEPLPHSVFSSDSAGLKADVARNHQLDVVGPITHRACEVTLVRRREVIAHDLDVLLRNTPSPALRMGDFIRRV